MAGRREREAIGVACLVGGTRGGWFGGCGFTRWLCVSSKGEGSAGCVLPLVVRWAENVVRQQRVVSQVTKEAKREL